jgi:hypothetical protein
VPRHVSRSLAVWSGVLLALLAAHDLTHALDDGLETRPGDLAFVAMPQWLLLAAVIAVVLGGNRGLGAAAALVLGLGVSIGFAVIHLLPFSLAAYWELQPSVASWLLAWLPAALGLAVAALAWSQRRPAIGPRGRG